MAEQITALDAARQALSEAAKIAAGALWDDSERFNVLLETASINAAIASAEAQIASANALTAGLDLLLEIKQTLDGRLRDIDRSIDSLAE